MSEIKFHGIRAESAIHAFRIAAANSKLKEMQLLLDNGVDINAIDPSFPSTALATATGLGLIRSVNFLLEKGADPNIICRDNMTPLMYACSFGGIKGSRIALRLIEAKADVNYFRSDEMTALKFAATRCKPEVIQALIDNGAEINGPAGTSQTALMLAARAGNVDTIRVLVKNGADITLTCGLPWAKNLTALGLAKLEKRKCAIEYLAFLTSSI